MPCVRVIRPAQRSEVVRMAVYCLRTRYCNDLAVAVVESPYQAMRGEERIALGFSRWLIVSTFSARGRNEPSATLHRLVSSDGNSRLGSRLRRRRHRAAGASSRSPPAYDGHGHPGDRRTRVAGGNRAAPSRGARPERAGNGGHLRDLGEQQRRRGDGERGRACNCGRQRDCNCGRQRDCDDHGECGRGVGDRDRDGCTDGERGHDRARRRYAGGGGHATAGGGGH